MPSGRQLGRENFAVFSAWVSEWQARNDYLDYIHRGKLNRTEVSTELGISSSSFRSNPAIKKLAQELDELWGSQQPGTLTSAAEESAARVRADDKVKRTEASNSRLLEKIATLEQENRQLRHQLEEVRQFKTAREAFLETTKDFYYP